MLSLGFLELVKAELIQEIMADTEKVSAAALEQSAFSRQVTNLAENMEQVSDNLQNSVILFEIAGNS